MAHVVVPIRPGQNQTLQIALPINGANTTLTLTLTWNEPGQYWWMTVANAQGVLLDGVPLVTGKYPAANILKQYQYLNIGSAYLVPDSGTLADNPDFTQLGASPTGNSSFHLIWGDNSPV